VKVLEMRRTSPARKIEQRSVSSPQLGMVRTILWTADPQRKTGHRYRWPERRWVRASIFLPFFWSSKTMVTYAACVSRWGSEWESTARERVRKTMHPIRTRLVRPLVFVVTYSQDRIAKKNAPRMRSAVCACATLLVPLANL
jgi:hypothetical protein